MYSTYLVVSAVSHLALKEPECEQSPSARSNRTVEPCCESTGPTYLSSQISSSSTVLMLEQQWTLFAEDFPVRIFPSPERAKALQAAVVAYGKTSPDLLARYDPATSSWKTSQLCLDGGLATFSATWPRSGMMRNGIAYRLPPLAPRTDATASGSWA